MSNKPLTDKELFSSYKSYEAYVDKQVKSGSLPNQVARVLLRDARKNYSNKEYNRQLGKIR
jgi:hypothetical protein